MHPLVAIGLVFLTGLAWTVTVLTLLIALAKDRRRPQTEVRTTDQAEAQTADVEAV
ncbi:hypothetical protein [Pseudarthrobacter sp. NamE2]|uniref:hypothetical protein n=1 Tax=Pseudarthrobacter sp. NamE2 TaxID=2576838 RepID=UPI001484DEFF|nr:hypothetical protein [Pseudarthrobacter sp. NamE2]